MKNSPVYHFRIDFSQPVHKARHDKLVDLVEKKLPVKKQLSAARTDGDKDFYLKK